MKKSIIPVIFSVALLGTSCSDTDIYDESKNLTEDILAQIQGPNRVVEMYNVTESELLTAMSNSAGEYTVVARMVEACGLMDTLSKTHDELYDSLYNAGVIPDRVVTQLGEYGTFYTPEHRLYGFTLFAEPDDLWEKTFGKEAASITLQELEALAKRYYPEAQADGNFQSPENALNQFITYHLIPVKLPSDKLVYHYNERGYSPTTKTLSVPMYELYTTMGKRRMLKIYESAESDGVYLNRFPNLRSGRRQDYHEAGCDVDKVGAYIDRDGLNHKVYGLVNGYVYPIDRILAYDEGTRDNLHDQRLRFDVTSIFPEFINNDIRINEITDERHSNVNIPSDYTYRYLEDAWIGADTYFFYWTGRSKGWQNYLGDEFTIRGLQDVTFRLPPVPKKGVYELRYAVLCGGIYRTVVEIYFGTDRDNLQILGAPYDLREGANYKYTKVGYYIHDNGWEQDTTDDEYNAMVDKNLRNHGFMKGCNMMTAGSPGGVNMMRASDITLRRILTRQEMDPDKTYYLRFKSVLNDPATYLYFDYLEFCPQEIFDNPDRGEDIW